MLLFRSEEHVSKWLEEKRLQRGATFSVEQGWAMAKIWYSDRLSPTYRRRSAEEAEAIFAQLGLTGDFWRLTAHS